MTPREAYYYRLFDVAFSEPEATYEASALAAIHAVLNAPRYDETVERVAKELYGAAKRGSDWADCPFKTTWLAVARKAIELGAK